MPKITALAHKNEYMRKALHSGHAVFLTIICFHVPRWWIIVGEVGFLLLVSVARYAKWLEPLRHVGRRSWGELFYPLGIIGACLLTANPWFLAASFLHLGIADSLAAIIGKRYGRSTQFHILGQVRSAAGSSAFLASSISIMILLVISHQTVLSGWVIVIPLLVTVAEAMSVYGGDNLVIPLLVVLLLSIT